MSRNRRHGHQKKHDRKTYFELGVPVNIKWNTRKPREEYTVRPPIVVGKPQLNAKTS